LERLLADVTFDDALVVEPQGVLDGDKLSVFD
jgi:DNA-binding cell septation regulator SpoVG